MPRRSNADSRRTREGIVARAVEVGTAEGLEGVTLGRLAEDMGMSKAGVINHFGSKENLQLAAVQYARERFKREVWDPIEYLEPGIERLLALTDGWLADIAISHPGGCFWAQTSPEFDARPGPVREAVLAMADEWSRLLAGEVKAARENGELPEDTEVRQVVFELRAVALGLNQEVQLHGDPAALRRARKAVRRVLGRPDLPLGRTATRSAVPAGT